MDLDFEGSAEGLQHALHLMLRPAESVASATVTAAFHGLTRLPEQGVGARQALDMLAPRVLAGATRLGAPHALAHMDPPTPWLTWAATLWNASLNQNLLHPATAPVAREVEQQAVAWLAPFFGMGGGHMTPGSTLANLTALWAARECAGVTEVVASDNAHLSIPKAAHLLGLKFRAIAADPHGGLRADAGLGPLDKSALVLTAGTTSTGAVDALSLCGRAAWTHVDAAWAGPLRLSTTHAPRLEGIERADSVAISAHKWLFQPKESALALFRDVERAHAAVSFNGAYLATPNVGVLGSHGAMAVPLLATLLAWGREGYAARIDRCMAMSEKLYTALHADPRVQTLCEPAAGVVVWRPVQPSSFDTVQQGLPHKMTSTTVLRGERWFRQVAANPNAEVDLVLATIRTALERA
jgi:L-2,4-diaminobutyrate decarboxylase